MNDKLFNRNWNANVGASTFSTAWKPSTEERLYERVEGGYKLTVKGTNSGADYEWGYTAIKDGEEFPVHGRNDVDSIIAYKVTEEITIGDFLKGGKVVALYKRKMSLDGSSLQVIVAGVDNDAKPYFDVIEYTAE